MASAMTMAKFETARDRKSGWPQAAGVLLLALQLSACMTPVSMPSMPGSASTPTRPAATQPADATSQPIAVRGRSDLRTSAFKKLQIAVPSGQLADLQDGMFCSFKEKIQVNQQLAQQLAVAAGVAFARQMDQQGYPRLRRSESVFEAQQPAQVDYEVGATLRDAQGALCLRNGAMQGQLAVKVRWEVFHPRSQQVIYAAQTDGLWRGDGSEKLALAGVLERAIAASLQAVQADQRFVDAMTKPTETLTTMTVAQQLRIPQVKAPAGSLQQNIPVLRSAVVTIERPGGTGSGFFISRSGYLLTNQHVIGRETFVRVKLITGRELIAEVIRRDAGRDVALLKTEPINFDPLAVAQAEPNIGEEVIAIGSPMGRTFEASVTRGIVSGQRMIREQRYIQSDVAIFSGSSGGPLLNSRGEVVGVAVSAVESGRANLNLFIPVREAMQRMQVVMQ